MRLLLVVALGLVACGEDDKDAVVKTVQVAAEQAEAEATDGSCPQPAPMDELKPCDR